MNPDAMLSRMRDIRGLDPVSYWPLAPGWWVLVIALAAAVLGSIYGARFYRRWQEAKMQRWRTEAVRMLNDLERRIDRDSAKEVSLSLSELLRRIAVAQHGREACAGLEGERWLTWLNDNDPHGFSWRNYRTYLLELPYAPPALAASPQAGDALRALIGAARAWARNGQIGAPQRSGDGI